MKEKSHAVLGNVAALILTGVTVFAQQGLNNDAILKMVKAGLGDAVVLPTINSQPGQYSVTPDDLIALKKAGVSDAVIGAMVARVTGTPVSSSAPAAAPRSATASGATAPATPTLELGIYLKKANEWTEVLPEVVNWKTGGALKSLATASIAGSAEGEC